MYVTGYPKILVVGGGRNDAINVWPGCLDHDAQGMGYFVGKLEAKTTKPLEEVIEEFESEPVDDVAKKS